jgi:ribosomal protein S18 acetylase RimI-like enzyme
MLKEQILNKSIVVRFFVRASEMADMDDIMELLEICDLTTIGEVESSKEMLKTDWTLPEVDLERNFRMVTTQNGRTVGYMELWDTNEPLVKAWAWGRTHPEFEGLGIGTYLMDWAEKQARQAIVKAPENARFSMESGTPSKCRQAHELLQNQGMQLKRHFWTMMIDLDEQIPDPQLPAHIQIRPMAGVEELPAVTHAVRAAFKDHWGFVEQSFESELKHWQHIIDSDPTFDTNLWFLAVEGDEIAGMSLCWPKYGPNEETAWVGTLGVLRPWRRQRLGLALLHHSFQEFSRRGKERVGLGVDASSLTGATGLYEKAGMHVARQFDQYEKELRPGIDLATRTVEE